MLRRVAADCCIRSCRSSPKRSGRRCGRTVDDAGAGEHLAVAKFPLRSHRRHLSRRSSGDGACIAATEAINSLRSLLGYHPGQRVEASIKFLRGRRGRGGVSRGVRSDGSPTPRPWPRRQASDSQVRRTTAQGGMVTAVLGWCEVAVMAPEGFDFERARAALRKKLRRGHRPSQRSIRRVWKIPTSSPKPRPKCRSRCSSVRRNWPASEELLRKQMRLLEVN